MATITRRRVGHYLGWHIAGGRPTYILLAMAGMASGGRFATTGHVTSDTPTPLATASTLRLSLRQRCHAEMESEYGDTLRYLSGIRIADAVIG